MALQPATTLRLLSGIDFTDTYEDVILFDLPSEQTEFFLSKPGISFGENSCQRPEAGYCKISTTYAIANNYSYMMFRNTAHNDRWFYAFIDEVEYINETTVGVTFHLDVMQSFMFNYTLGESFVVREHAETDSPGDNLVPENLFYGDYVYDAFFDQLEVDASECAFGFSGTLSADDMCIVVAYNPAILDITSASVPEKYLWNENLYGGVYQGVKFICIPFTSKMGDDGIAEIVGYLDALFGLIDVGSLGGIMGIFMMPIIFLPKQNEPSWYNVQHGVSYDPPTHVSGHTPVNKKLLTYPYVAINATNGRDGGMDYAYEFFINRKPSFIYEGTLSVSPRCICYPIGYKGRTFALEDGVSLDSYPLVTWGEDGFTEWFSNHLFSSAIGISLAAGTAGASAYPAAYAAAQPKKWQAVRHYSPGMSRREAKNIMHAAPKYATHLANRRANEIALGEAAKATVNSVAEGALGAVGQAASCPPTGGGLNAHDLLFGNVFGKSIRIRKKNITRDFAERLDSYFTRYGYATNEVKVPNLRSRPFYNFVQLANPNFNDISCPMGVINEIMSVYESGVTFWRPNAQIGVYDPDVQDNSI